MQNQNEVIQVRDVSMCFNMHKQKIDNLKEYAIKFLKADIRYDEFWALKDVSFSAVKGETLGIVGVNGSGKSTILKLIAGVLKPTEGKVNVYGNIAPLIELGAGFDTELTARENIYLNGAVLGYSRQKMNENFDSIVKFSELEDFIDVPIKNYSSGMMARLGFSIATFEKPDVLILDEVLAVGDFKFQDKCQVRLNEISSEDTTILLVSHNIKQIEKMCQKVVWLEKGKVKMYGDTDEVCNAYKKS